MTKKSIKIKLIKFMNDADFGVKIARDYYDGDNEYYRADLKKVHEARNEALQALQAIDAIGVQ